MDRLGSATVGDRTARANVLNGTSYSNEKIGYLYNCKKPGARWIFRGGAK
jgi:hypothetical protein